MYLKKLTLGDTFINNRSNAAGSFNFHLQRFLHGDWGRMISTPPQNVNYPNVIESWTLNFRCEETVREISRLKDQIYDLVKSDLKAGKTCHKSVTATCDKIKKNKDKVTTSHIAGFIKVVDAMLAYGHV